MLHVVWLSGGGCAQHGEAGRSVCPPGSVAKTRLCNEESEKYICVCIRLLNIYIYIYTYTHLYLSLLVHVLDLGFRVELFTYAEAPNLKL